VISSLLALQSHYSAEVYTREMMQESQNRVRSMALVHEQLYQDQDLTNIDCARYLRTLIEHLERAYQPQAGTVNLNIEVAEVLLNIDQAIPCGLIVNELVSNALKHAFPGGQDGQIHFQLRTNEAKTIARLTVADTGVGLPLAIDFKATDSLGLQLVNILTRQLSGSVELDRSQGTAFTVEFLIGGADSEHS
jgi:two-component sensor histidine kinase